MLLYDRSVFPLDQVNLPPSDDQPPPAKKAKIAAGKKKKGPKGSASTTTTTATKSVMAHSIILSSKSEYFKAVLSRGKWAESKTRTIEVDLPSEEGKVDMRQTALHSNILLFMMIPLQQESLFTYTDRSFNPVSSSVAKSPWWLCFAAIMVFLPQLWMPSTF